MDKYRLRKHASLALSGELVGYIQEKFLWDYPIIIYTYEMGGGMENEINDKPLVVNDSGWG